MVSNVIKKAVIVESALGEGGLLSLPVGRELLIDHLLGTLSRHGINEVAIVTADEVSAGTAERTTFAGHEGEIKVLWEVAPFYRGTAGSLKFVQEFLDEPQFIVVHCNLYLAGLNLSDVVAAHHQGRAGVTFVAYRDVDDKEDLENIEIDQSGLIAQVNILHRSRNRRRRLRPCGIYVMNREVLDVIPSGEYFDIKEQLVPSGRAKGMAVRAHEVKHPAYTIRKSEDLLELNRQILLGEGLPHEGHDRWCTGIDRIVIGDNAHISPSSFLIGPLVIGPNSIVEDHAQVIGPAVIGAATRLEKGSMVRESVVWSGTRVLSNARVEYSFIPSDMIVPEGTRLRHAHRMKASAINGVTRQHSLPDVESVAWAPNLWGRVSERDGGKNSIYCFIKRTMDLVLSSLLLLLGLPLLVLIALVIKLDSSGPVLFGQNRCGKDGKEFRMLKFRTMVPDAEKRQAVLRARNGVDGPMFKLEEDPRITRVGKFLRKTSLDELPQLINVLRGEMSLVGPRPLAYAEMKFCPSWRDFRLMVTPGVTGLWQVESRNRNRFSDWIRYDIEYVQTQSLSVDLRILIGTVAVLLKGM
jgi:lipopolysaccharide/colanic/teichoic acid biosynthesis glycosyltransferase/NDP-sugar pyrophosphorylase family protein